MSQVHIQDATRVAFDASSLLQSIPSTFNLDAAEVDGKLAHESTVTPNFSCEDQKEMDVGGHQLASSLSRRSQDHRSTMGSKSWNKQIVSSQSLLKQYFCGSVRIKQVVRSSSLAAIECNKYMEEDQFEKQTSISINPSAWMRWLGIVCGFHMHLNNSYSHSWKFSLDSFRRVDDDAPIYRLCSEGNLAAVRELLIRGEASAKDTDSRGTTPLHVSSYRLH